jgi:hypothetical protein
MVPTQGKQIFPLNIYWTELVSVFISAVIMGVLRVFENRMLRRIFGPKRDEVTGGGENYIMRSFITCTFGQV